MPLQALRKHYRQGKSKRSDVSDLLDLTVDTNSLRVSNREGDRREFKARFDNNALWKYAKTMVSFANRDGGVIFFGVTDRPRKLIKDKNQLPDELVFANFLKSHFEPEIRFTLDTKKIAGVELLYVLVENSPNKPIICKKRKIEKNKESGKPDKELLREGAIYYRYSSSTEEIKHPELKNILEKSVQKIFRSMIDNITLLNKVGHDRAAVVDAGELSGDDKKASVYITTETAKNINWIKKGRFSESEDTADKAYYVTREIEIKHGVEVEVNVDPSKTHKITKTALSEAVKINNTYINAILWKLGMLNNDKYHISMPHGKSTLHKFTDQAIEKIIENYPLDSDNRKKDVTSTYYEYKGLQRN